MRNRIYCCIPFIFISMSFIFAQDVADKAYKGAELYTKDAKVLYGKFEIRMKVASGSGLISSFYTFTDVGEGGKEIWEEVDFEIFGKEGASTFQTNILTSTPGAPNVEETFDVGISLADVYHTYTLEWRPDSIIWKLDGKLVRVIKEGKTLELTDPQSFQLNLWSSNVLDRVGEFDITKLPVYTYINWIKFYAWNGSKFDTAPSWTDNFDTLDAARWSPANWTFDVSNVDFAPENATVKDGVLVLSITAADAEKYDGTPPLDDVILEVIEEDSQSAIRQADVSTAVVEKLLDPKDVVYTNASHTVLKFRTTILAKVLTIVDKRGKTLKKIKNYRAGQSVDISFLKSGEYGLEVSKNETYAFKVVR